MLSPRNLIFSFTLLILASCTNQNSDHDQSHSKSHGHDHTPHEGVLVAFRADQKESGFVELKLHDDKGDLELWLTKDKEGKQPFDIALDSVITVTFSRLGPKIVKLKIRNDKENEDEDGKGHIRNKKTNYFIFPGDTKADASFLVGKDFSNAATVTFTSDGVRYTSSPFNLRPHTH